MKLKEIELGPVSIHTMVYDRFNYCMTCRPLGIFGKNLNTDNREQAIINAEKVIESQYLRICGVRNQFNTAKNSTNE
jgi:hypothetical protein